jgi:hypothetical protein
LVTYLERKDVHGGFLRTRSNGEYLDLKERNEEESG